MKTATVDALFPTHDLPARRGFDPAALAALFTLTLRQHARGRRLLIISLLFLLPSALVIVIRLAQRPPSPEELEFDFVFNFIPHALVPLIALLYAAGMVQDEIEEQTLTYLLLRPISRPLLYLTKLAATWFVTALLAAVFTAITFSVIWWGKSVPAVEVPVQTAKAETESAPREGIPVRAAKTAALLALAQLGYCSLFGALGLYTRRSLLIGLAYIVAFEGLLANVPMMIRQFTVMYYFRVLATRWLAPPGSKAWALDLNEAWSERSCVLTLLGASAVATILGAVMMARREFRMKTPEGS